MKLAIITAYPPSKIILNEYAYHLIKHFRQQQKITELILLTDKTPEKKSIVFKEQGCKINVKACWEYNSYTNVSSVNKALNKTKPDAVLFNLQFTKFGNKKIPAGLSLLLPLICKIKQIPTIALLHNVLEEDTLKKKSFIAKKLHKVFTKLVLKADVVAVTMQKHVEFLEDNYKANNIKLIPHGTFETPTKPTGVLPKGPLKIMTFGKFGTYKKVGNLIEAVVQLRATTGLDLEIVIAGTDTMTSSGYLETITKKYKRVPQINFTGYIAEDNIAKVFKESAVVVLPHTATTGNSGVLHQAGSYGKAVVMPNIGDLATLVTAEGYKGEFFEPNSIDSLANAIKEIVTNQVYRKYLEEINYKAATAYPMERVTNIYVQEFEKIIALKSIDAMYAEASIV